MQKKDRITIEVPTGPSKVLSLVSKASGVAKEKLIGSMFVIMAHEVLSSKKQDEHRNTSTRTESSALGKEEA